MGMYTTAGQKIGAYVASAQAPMPAAPTWELATLAGFVSALATALYAELRGARNDWKKQAQDGAAELTKMNESVRLAAEVAERQNRALLDAVAKIDKLQSDVGGVSRDVATIMRYIEDDRRRAS